MGATAEKLIERMTVTGIEDLDRKLKKLTNQQFRAIVGKASNRAMKPVEKIARAGAPRESGLLRKSIGRKQKRYKRASVTVTMVGPRIGFKKLVSVPGRKKAQLRNPAMYAHLVEGGTAPHSLGKDSVRFLRKGGGKTPGQQFGKQHPGSAPQPFLKPALVRQTAQTVKIYADEMRRFVDEATR